MKTKNTGIRIETVKEVNDKGEAGYRITGITALKRDHLPALYLNGIGVSVYCEESGHHTPDKILQLKNSEKVVYVDHWSYISNRFYTAEDMEKILTHVRKAGQHLADVNAHLKKERANWNGKVTFVDGVDEQTKTVLSEKPNVESESVPEHISRLWATGNLYYVNEDGQIKPFPKPKIKEKI